VAPEQWQNWGVFDGGVYAVISPDDGDPQLVMLDERGSLRRLTRLPEFAWSGVTVSADGRRVIYAHADRREANVGGIVPVR